MLVVIVGQIEELQPRTYYCMDTLKKIIVGQAIYIQHRDLHMLVGGDTRARDRDRDVVSLLLCKV